MKKHPVPGTRLGVCTLWQTITDAERRLWQILRSRQMQGSKFRREAPIGRCIADFVCHGARLFIEIDGGQRDQSSLREAGRSGFLQCEGYRMVRFWNDEVLANLDGVHETIAEALRRITPTQTLPNEEGLLSR